MFSLFTWAVWSGRSTGDTFVMAAVFPLLKCSFLCPSARPERLSLIFKGVFFLLKESLSLYDIVRK